MFALRRICSHAKIQFYRSYSAGSKLVEVTHNNDTGISTISMASPPFNILNLELLNALKKSLIETQENKSQGIIFTSSVPHIFSAGLDIKAFLENEENISHFWNTLQDTWLTFYDMDIPVAAAITGASPAGGCMLAISSEYRVFIQGKYAIGLNEALLGLSVPVWFKNLYVDVLGYKTAATALLRGSMFSPEKALEIGLVDELGADRADTIKKCENYLLSFKKIPSIGRIQIRKELRKKNLQWLQEHKELDTEQTVSFAKSPMVQNAIKRYLESLKQK